MTSIVALIPARSGSERIKDKNIRLLDGKPLLQRAIESAQESGIFTGITVVSDSDSYLRLADEASVSWYKENEAESIGPDIGWVRNVLPIFEGHRDCFAILRPTSPFRTAETIRRAWWQFQSQGRGVDSLRAVEKCLQHPGKMWTLNADTLVPLLPLGPTDPPWHSSPYQNLPEVYVQNASLEIAWTRTVLNLNSIAGTRIMPFFTEGYEGFDINVEEDLTLAEYLIKEGKVLNHSGTHA